MMTFVSSIATMALLHVFFLDLNSTEISFCQLSIIKFTIHSRIMRYQIH